MGGLPQHLDLAQLRHDLLRRKSLPSHLLSPFQSNTLISPGSEKAGQVNGKIVNIGGGSGMRGYRNRAGYSSSKWAVRGLTRTTALDVGEFNINCNAVMPGIVETPRMENLCRVKAEKRGWTYEQVYAEYVSEMALARVTTPQDVANLVAFLASDDSRNITGQEVVVDGGWAV